MLTTLALAERIISERPSRGVKYEEMRSIICSEILRKKEYIRIRRSLDGPFMPPGEKLTLILIFEVQTYVTPIY